jgi:signal transduction histidine kinase
MDGDKSRNYSRKLLGRAYHHQCRSRQTSLCLINLVYNAIKFTPQGGQVQLDTRVRDDGSVQFCVSDAGPGIPPNELPRIFDAFYTGESVPPEQRGTGLSLTVCKGLVELHYGNIWVESELGKGSAFYVILPMRR